MTDKEKNNDDYELPSGITLPKDNSSDYPNWKKGIIFAIPGGIIFGLILIIPPLTNKIFSGVLGFIMGFLIVGSIVAFRPPKN